MSNIQLTYELPLLGDVKRSPEILAEHQEYLLDQLLTPKDAIAFSIQYARRTQVGVGEDLGLSKSHWSGIVNGNKNMSWKIKDRFMDLINNDILLQWYAWKRGYRLQRRNEREVDRLSQENEQLKRELAQMKDAETRY